MKVIIFLIGNFLGMFLAIIFSESELWFLGVIAWIGCIYGASQINKSIDESEEEKYRRSEQQRREENERASKERKRKEAIELARKYPEATKQYFKKYWGITKSFIYDSDITDDKVDTLLTRRYSYESDERTYNTAYKAKIEAQEREKREADKREAERVRREKELIAQRKELERRNLINSLPACVNSWSSYSNSSLKHKYYYDYYPYAIYKDSASSTMWDTWKTVWNFKNDPLKGISSSDYNLALLKVVNLVKATLRSTFGSKTEYLTFVCLTASTQIKTDLRFKEFANRVCKDLNMTNAYEYIKVSGDGRAKHEGGSGVGEKLYVTSFFRDKYVVLFDDVRTSGRSIENERQILESLGAKVICVITIAQTIVDN